MKPDLYERQRAQVRAEPFVVVRGELQRRDGRVNVMADQFTLLRAHSALAPEVHDFG